jgi:LisH domain-containing protein ARMC9
MIQLFCQGQRKEFFRRWLQNIPASLLTEDLSAQKLEFELNIHFAIYPLRRGGRDAKVQSEESMSSFKTYLENRGRSLSQTTEFLPFFALPYVPNPQDNHGYQKIFSVNL